MCRLSEEGAQGTDHLRAEDHKIDNDNAEKHHLVKLELGINPGRQCAVHVYAIVAVNAARIAVCGGERRADRSVSFG